MLDQTPSPERYTPEPPWPWWKRTLLISAIWAVPAMATTLAMILDKPPEGEERDLWGNLFKSLFMWALLAMITPVVLAVERRAPFGPGRPLRPALLHLLTGIAVAVGLAVILAPVTLLMDGDGLTAERLRDRYEGSLPFTLWTIILYWLVVAVATAIGNARRMRNQRRRAAALEASLTEARLASLRAQLHPHFLFNTLNSIASLVRQERGPEAVDMIGRLGSLLRTSLRQDDAALIPLAEEVELAEEYLAIEHTRFGDRLRVHVELAPATEVVPVPPMLLQPLVENAVRHGAVSTAEGGEVIIRASIDDDRLVVRVENDGPFSTPELHDGRGAGLRITRQRLEALYGPDHRLTVGERDGIVVVEIVLPTHPTSRGTGDTS